MIDLSYIPSCWDFANGSFFDIGTPTPAGAILLNYVNGNSPDETGYVPIFEEASDSPTVEFGEQCTITHKFYCDYYTGQQLQISYPRKTIMEANGSFDPVTGDPSVSRVLSTTLQPIAKTDHQVCLVTVISEAQSFANPPDEFSIEVVELNPALEKHPRYSALTYKTRNAVRNANVSDFIDVAQEYVQLLKTLSGSAIQSENQQGQAIELLLKRQKGEDSFYLSGYKMTYTQYFWGPQTINPGGYIDDPFTVIPSDYWTDDNGENIFKYNAYYNQNLFPNIDSLTDPPYGLSWLRQTDIQILNRTWWKVTHTWIAGPLGHWDNELYNPVTQPLQTSFDQGGISL